MTEHTFTLEKLIETIKGSNEPWGLLTGNGFNLACDVKTDYQSLCEALVYSFSEELSAEEINQLNTELASENFNFEVWLSKKSKPGYIEKIALKSIHRQWLVEFVKACSQDHKQYIYISYHGDNPASVKQRAEELFNGKTLQFFQSKQFVEETSAVEEETK